MRDILNSYTTAELRKHISKFNKSLGLVKGYSKMKKADLINLMTKKENVDKFKSIKMKPKKERTTTKTATKTTTKTQPKKKTTTTTLKQKPKKEEPKKETPKKPKETPKKPKEQPKKEAPKKPKEQPKKEEPKKETPKKPKEQPKKEEPKKQTSGMLKAKIKQVKPGDKGFVKDFKTLTKAQQLDAMKNQIELTGTPPNSKWYKDNADKFYSGIFTLLNKSASRAIPAIINDYQLTFEDLKNIYFGQTKGTVIDFYPTPDKCIKELYDALPSAFKNRTGFELLEGTAGIGNVSNWFSKNTNYNVVSNELNPNLFKIMNKFLPDKVKTLNKDFFNLDVGRTLNPDVIFLNPPFGEKNNKLWFKFLLKGFQYLKDSKNRNNILLFIAPSMFSGRVKGIKFANMKYLIKDYGEDGTVPIGKAQEYINEVFKKNYTLKEYKNVINENINTENEEELNEFFEDELNFDIGEIVNECEGFGGTGVRTQLALIQYIK